MLSLDLDRSCYVQATLSISHLTLLEILTKKSKGELPTPDKVTRRDSLCGSHFLYTLSAYVLYAHTFVQGKITRWIRA